MANTERGQGHTLHKLIGLTYGHLGKVNIVFYVLLILNTSSSHSIVWKNDARIWRHIATRTTIPPDFSTEIRMVMW